MAGEIGATRRRLPRYQRLSPPRRRRWPLWPARGTPEAIRTDLSESLERLGTDHVELYLLHRDDDWVEPDPLIEALNAEKATGRIASFGASNWASDRIDAANRYAADLLL